MRFRSLITKDTLANHFRYCWWRYVVMIALTVITIEMLFSMTEHRASRDKKTEFLICTGYVDSGIIEDYLWPIVHEAYPEQEELQVIGINLDSNDMYAPMQFTTYLATQTGDLFLLPKKQFGILLEDADDSILLDLSPYLNEIKSYIVENDSIEIGDRVFGLHMTDEYTLCQYSKIFDNAVLCVPNYSQNIETQIYIINQLLSH